MFFNACGTHSFHDVLALGSVAQDHESCSTAALPQDRERIVSGAALDDDSSFELKLRPQRLVEFIGQSKVKENLAVAIEAAKSRGEALDHVLLYGPPGLGKTTIAYNDPQYIVRRHGLDPALAANLAALVPLIERAAQA